MGLLILGVHEIRTRETRARASPVIPSRRIPRALAERCIVPGQYSLKAVGDGFRPWLACVAHNSLTRRMPHGPRIQPHKACAQALESRKNQPAEPARNEAGMVVHGWTMPSTSPGE